MYAMFMQGRNGLAWLSNHSTLAEAREIMNELVNETEDFVMILPISGFRDLDGEKGE